MNRKNDSLPRPINRPELPRLAGRVTREVVPTSLFLATVVTVNPIAFTVSVMTNEGKIINNVLLLNKGVSSIERSQTWLETYRGRLCVVTYIDDHYIVMGTLPTDLISEEELEDTSPFIQEGTGADTESAYKTGVNNYINQGRKDYLDGDKVLSTTDNVSLGLFKGGVLNLKVSSLTQLILHKLKALFRIVTRNFELFTDFGKITIKNEEGKTFCKLEGGASFAEETMPGTDKFSVEITMGSIESDENKRISIIVKDPNNDSSKVEVGLGIDGIIQINCSEKAEISSEKEMILSSQNDFTIDSKGSIMLNAIKDVNIVSKNNLTMQGAVSTSVKSDANVSVSGQLIRLN